MPVPRRYDSDDIDDLDDHNDTGPSPWRRRLITWSMAAVALGLGFLIPYTLYLNHEVGERFGQLRWQIPTRVYARPLALAPGKVFRLVVNQQIVRGDTAIPDGAEVGILPPVTGG